MSAPFAFSAPFQPFQYTRIRYVDPVNGSDSNPGSFERPWQTAAYAAANIGNIGSTLYLAPGTYTGNVNWTALNVDVVGMASASGIVNITGAWTFAHASSSVRVQAVSFGGGFSHTGAGALYLVACSAAAATKSGAGYFETTDTDFTVSFTVSGSGIASMSGGTQRQIGIGGTAIVGIYNSISCTNVSATGGSVYLAESTVYSDTPAGVAVTTSGTSVVFIRNCLVYDTTGNLTIVSLGGAAYSLTDVQFNRANSVLTAANLGSIAWFDNLSAISNFIPAIRSVTASATPIVLTPTSAQWQSVSGTVAQTIRLPATTAVTIGTSWVINNLSTAVVTVLNSGGTTITTVPASQTAEFTYTNVSTNSGWAFTFRESVYDGEFHVSPTNGSNTTGIGSFDRPWATITYALANVTGTNPIIFLHAGTYAENVTIAQTVTITGFDIVTSNSTGSSVSCTGAWVVNSGTVTLNNFAIASATTVAINNASNVLGENMIVSAFNHGSTGTITFNNCVFTGANTFTQPTVTGLLTYNLCTLNVAQIWAINAGGFVLMTNCQSRYVIQNNGAVTAVNTQFIRTVTFGYTASQGTVNLINCRLTTTLGASALVAAPLELVSGVNFSVAGTIFEPTGSLIPVGAINRGLSTNFDRLFVRAPALTSPVRGAIDALTGEIGPLPSNTNIPRTINGAFYQLPPANPQAGDSYIVSQTLPGGSPWQVAGFSGQLVTWDGYRWVASTTSAGAQPTGAVVIGDNPASASFATNNPQAGQVFQSRNGTWLQKGSTIGAHNTELAYRQGDLAIRNSDIYVANGEIPQATVFAIGTTGATWRNVGFAPASGQVVLADGVIQLPSGTAADIATFLLPLAGTYMINFSGRFTLPSPGNYGTIFLADAGNITFDNTRTISQFMVGGSTSYTDFQTTTSASSLLTVTGPTTIKLRAASVAGNVAIISDGAGRTRVAWARVGP